MAHAGSHDPSQEFGTIASLGYGEQLAGSTLAADWQKYFDAYDPTKEQMYGQQYQTQLGGLFEQAGAGVTSLMESWAGAGQVMSGRKGRQKKAIGQQTALESQKLGQGLAQDVYGARESWEQQQRSNLNTLLGMDIWGEDMGGPSPLAECTGPGCINPTGNQCPTGYYMASLESGLSGCQPTSGGEDQPDLYEMNPEEQCASKGGFWETDPTGGGSCVFAGGSGGGEEGGGV